MENQTEIVYSVFVDGKPVLAVTAAKDMQLVTEQEVAQIMDNIVYTKAERKYLINIFKNNVSDYFTLLKILWWS